MYCQYMAAVDRMDRRIAYANTRMHKCRRRYHRQLFLGWLLPTIGFNNVLIAFKAFMDPDELAELRRRAESRTGFLTLLQYKLGVGLIRVGLARARKQLGSG